MKTARTKARSCTGIWTLSPAWSTRGIEKLEGTGMHHRGSIPVQRPGMGVDEVNPDPSAAELRGKEQPRRTGADHENSRIRNHVDPARV
jgi:hypothetical protein